MKVEMDMDIDGVENEFVFFDKLKMMFGFMGGFVNIGNMIYIVSFVVKLNESIMEIEYIVFKSVMK